MLSSMPIELANHAMTTRILLGLGLALVLFFGASHPVHAQAPVPAAHFFEDDAFSGAVFSPDGQHIAVRMSKPGRRNFLAVINLDTRAAVVAAEYLDFDIGNFQWVNNERLAYNVVDLTEVVGDRLNTPGLFAVNRDGGGRVQLAHHAVNSRRSEAYLGWNFFLLDQTGSQDSEWLYVERMLYDKNWRYVGSELARVNTLNGKTASVPKPDENVGAYLLDAKGQPRLAMGVAGGNSTMFYLDSASQQWRKVASRKAYTSARDDVQPVGFGADGTLYVIANAGEDLATLRTFDVATGKLGTEALVATPGYDVAGSLLRSDRVLGIRLTTDAENDIWFDPAMKALQATINQRLPHTVNLLTVPARPGSPWILVQSYSDRQPSTYSLYDTRSAALEPIGATYPGIVPGRSGTQEPISFRARDGLGIPGLLTLPPGGARKNLPMVVLVHGGPWLRGASWGWQPDSQFLASRGYAVLEVEFRGSTGFGARHFEAGMKQWGLAMQNDLADGTRWAIREGIADPRRICIGGASYGGYATLMGLANDPDLYACGINWLGVTDIALMYTGTWDVKSDLTEGYRRYGMPVLIGDLEADAKQLAATSPILQADRIRQPLLLAYGSEDRRVPLHHGKKFYEAARKTNRQIEWVVYDGEGHGWSLARNRIDFWQRVERFLHKHIGADALARTAAARP